MKKINKNYMKLLLIGILVMNIGVISNYFIIINGDIIDFFKGLGIILVFTGFFKLLKIQRYKQS